MGRLLVLVLLVVFAVWVVKRALRAPAKDEPSVKAPIEGELVACARCGVNLPREEAREAGGALFCGEEHARLGRSAGPGPR